MSTLVKMVNVSEAQLFVMELKTAMTDPMKH